MDFKECPLPNVVSLMMGWLSDWCCLGGEGLILMIYMIDYY